MSFVGARWWKFDFHTHAPASFDYGKSDSELKTSKSPRDRLLDYIAKGIECVAITDHSTGDWVDALKDAAEILRAENHSIFVFPSVEITANSNIHVLAIFDPSATSADINAVVGASKFRGTKGDQGVGVLDPADCSSYPIILLVFRCAFSFLKNHLNFPRDY